MATGAKPALDPIVENQTQTAETQEQKPKSLKDRIIQKLIHIFEHNERLGSTRQ